MARVERKIDDAFEEIKTLIKGMVLQNNEIMRQIINKKGGVNKGSILGNPAGVLDDVEEFKELKQIDPLKDYLKAFEELLVKVQISEGQALNCFLASMNHELKMMVRMFNPKTLQEAYSLAKLQEAIKQDSVGAIQGGGRVMYNKNSTSPGNFQGVKLSMVESYGVQVLKRVCQLS